MIFLVVAIFLLFTALVLDISISNTKNAGGEGGESLTNVGKIKLEIFKIVMIWIIQVLLWKLLENPSKVFLMIIYPSFLT